MTHTGPTPEATGAPVLLGIGLLRRLGRLRLRRPRSKKKKVERASAATLPRSRNDGVGSFLKSLVFSALLIAYLVAEVLVAMVAYMYLNLHHIETFGYLIKLSRSLLNEFAIQLERLSPELANRAYATLLGELGPKSILLLFIGLAVSMFIRFLIWLLHRSVEAARARRAPAAPAEPVSA